MKMANELVHVFQMPLPREQRDLDYSRWQQNLIGVLQVEFGYDSTSELREPPRELQLTIDMRLAYRNKGIPTAPGSCTLMGWNTATWTASLHM